MESISNATGAPKPIGAYSQATIANGFVFCAGQVALDPVSGKLVDGGIVEQTEQVLKNLAAVLRAAKTDFSRVTMTSTFLTDLSHGKVVNEIYSRYVNSESPPARQTLGVKELPLGALVEISVIATLG